MKNFYGPNFYKKVYYFVTKAYKPTLINVAKHVIVAHLGLDS